MWLRYNRPSPAMSFVFLRQLTPPGRRKQREEEYLLFAPYMLYACLPRQICSPLTRYALPTPKMRRIYLSCVARCVRSALPALEDALNLLAMSSVSRLQLTPCSSNCAP
ncbi:unnamed protein product [Citrullus colocynthis]|uniref:Uncharacterized protein n=1 Tax=Citrullus colocynthis TaxID=252529 RepID=A0ABP0Y453_9ROSI